MKNSIGKIIVLSIILTVISFVIIMFMGKTYTVVYILKNSNDYKLSIDQKDGEVEVLDEKEKDGKYLVKVKAKKVGKVYLYLNYGEFQEGKVLYIHPNMVITDNSYFGKATGSEVIPISLSIILIYSMLLLIKRYRICSKENLYQYKNIAYLGIIIFLSLFTINNILSIIEYQGLFETINKTITSISFVSFILLPRSISRFNSYIFRMCFNCYNNYCN